eukprot:1135208-Rhodomonas_salina.3
MPIPGDGQHLCSLGGGVEFMVCPPASWEALDLRHSTADLQHFAKAYRLSSGDEPYLSPPTAR